jgi:hypothetical protein
VVQVITRIEASNAAYTVDGEPSRYQPVSPRPTRGGVTLVVNELGSLRIGEVRPTVKANWR